MLSIFSRKQEMATPLGTTFSTDEQVVAQGDVNSMGKMVESLVLNSIRQSTRSSSLLALRAPGWRDITAGSPQKSTPEFLQRLPQRWLVQTEPFLVASHAWPASTSPTRPARPTSLKANLATSLLSTFLSFRLPGIPNNP